MADNLTTLAEVFAQLGDFTAGKASVQQALEILREIGDRLTERSPLLILGDIFWMVGDYTEALSKYEEGLSISKEVGDRDGEAKSLQNLCDVRMALGDFEKAQQHYGASLQLSKKIKGREREGRALLRLGELHLQQNHLSEAAEEFQQATKIFKDLGLPTSLDSQAASARYFFITGQHDQALFELAEILDYFERHGSLDGAWEPIKIYLTCYQVLEANEDGRAPLILEKAGKILQERAARIDDAELKRSYLENVPYNREIIQLWKKSNNRG